MTINKNNLSGEYHADVAALIAENERLERLFDQANKCVERVNAKYKKAWLEKLGEHYPDFGGFGDKLSRAEAERDRLKAENEALRKLLLDASEEIYAWGSYASDYFQEKHDLEGCVEKFHAAALGNGEQS